VTGGNSRADPARAPWSGLAVRLRHATHLESFLPPRRSAETRRLYESTAPDGGSLSPTSPPDALSAGAFATEWQRGAGLALPADGGSAGVTGALGQDWDKDQVIDQALTALCRR
jgi:hypothetical protein